VRTDPPFEISLRAFQRGDPRERNDPLIGKRLELGVFLTDAFELGARGLALRTVSLDLALRLSDTLFEDRYLDPSVQRGVPRTAASGRPSRVALKRRRSSP
jgi:hypothetical protein